MYFPCERFMGRAKAYFWVVFSVCLHGQASEPIFNSAYGTLTLQFEIYENKAAFKASVEAVKDYIGDRNWVIGFGKLKELCASSLNPGYIIKLSPDKEYALWRRPKVYLDQIVFSLEGEALEWYEIELGPIARRELEEAKELSDLEKLKKVAMCYARTDAGKEAWELLSNYYLDRGMHQQAIIGFERLQRQMPLEEFSVSMLVKYTVAEFKIFGVSARFSTLFKHLLKKSEGGNVSLGDQQISAKDLQDWIFQLHRVDVYGPSLNTNPQWIENSRAADLKKWTPRWKFPDHDRKDREGDYNYGTYASEYIHKMVGQIRVSPSEWRESFFPVYVGGKAIFRSHWGVHAVDIKTGELIWNYQVPLGLEHNKKESSLSNWLEKSRKTDPRYLNADSISKAMAASKTKVFIIEDIPIPVHYGERLFPSIRNESNTMTAIDIRSGRPLWKQPGPKASGNTDPNKNPKVALPLGKVIFLGPPLPLDEKLYVLAERGKSLEMIILQAGDGSVLKILKIGKVNQAVSQLRRLQPLKLSFREGKILCPTHLGILFALDPITDSVVWLLNYRPSDSLSLRYSPSNLTTLPRDRPLTVNAPEAYDGRVIFLPADRRAIYSLDSRDGTLYDKRHAGEAEYIAGVFGEHVVFVGNRDSFAFKLTQKGKLVEAWRSEEDFSAPPVGRGTRVGEAYWIPLQNGEIWSLNPQTGEILKKIDTKEAHVGNLLCVPGHLISQSGRGVQCVPISLQPLE